MRSMVEVSEVESDWEQLGDWWSHMLTTFVPDNAEWALTGARELLWWPGRLMQRVVFGQFPSERGSDQHKLRIWTRLFDEIPPEQCEAFEREVVRPLADENMLGCVSLDRVTGHVALAFCCDLPASRKDAWLVALTHVARVQTWAARLMLGRALELAAEAGLPTPVCSSVHVHPVRGPRGKSKGNSELIDPDACESSSARLLWFMGGSEPGPPGSLLEVPGGGTRLVIAGGAVTITVVPGWQHPLFGPGFRLVAELEADGEREPIEQLNLMNARSVTGSPAVGSWRIGPGGAEQLVSFVPEALAGGSPVRLLLGLFAEQAVHRALSRGEPTTPSCPTWAMN